MLLRLSLIVAVVGVVIGVIGAAVMGASVLFAVNSSQAADQAAPANRSGRFVIRQLPPLEATTEDDRRLRTRKTPTATVSFLEDSKLESQEMTKAKPSRKPSVTPTPTLAYLSLSSAADSGPSTSQESESPKTKTTATPSIKSSVITKTDVLSLSLINDALTETTPLSATDVVSTTPTAQTSEEAAESEALEPVETAESDEGVAAEPEAKYVEPYTSTNQVQAPPSADPTPEAVVAPFSCPISSEAHFDLIPIEGQPLKDHPANVHGDLNLALRGYVPTSAKLNLVDYKGATDGDAPQLHGLFEPNRVPEITTVYRVNDWVWDSSQCGGHPRGCPGPPADTFWSVTLVGLATTPGEVVHIPERGAQIYSGGFTALVLYAEEKRITLGYTRKDHVAAGYVVHLENVCVDPNLVGLYKAQEDADGWLATGHLPALRNNQRLGVALSSEIQVAVRDAGTFMDPRSQKDWWR